MVSKGSTPSFADGPDQALYLADPDGSRLRALTTPRYILSSEVWSPNGSTLLFVRSTTSNPHRSTIYRINADGSGEAPLAAMPAAFQFSPEWSPDGRRIVAYLDGTYILDPDGSIVDSLAGVGATWSPDGTRLAISADAGGHTGIHVIDADGTNETILSPFDDALENWPEWSPDGTKIAFFRRHPFSTLADTA